MQVVLQNNYGKTKKIKQQNVCERKTVYYHLQKANPLTNKDIGKEHKTKNAYAKGRHGVMSLHMSVCWTRHTSRTLGKESAHISIMPVF